MTAKEVSVNLENYNSWEYKSYPLTRAEARAILIALKELRAYKDTGLTPDHIRQIDKEFIKKCEELNETKQAAVSYKRLEGYNHDGKQLYIKEE